MGCPPAPVYKGAREGVAGLGGRAPRRSPTPTGSRIPPFQVVGVGVKERGEEEKEGGGATPPPSPSRTRPGGGGCVATRTGSRVTRGSRRWPGGSRRWPGQRRRAPRLASVRPPGRGGRGQGGGGGLGRPDGAGPGKWRQVSSVLFHIFLLFCFYLIFRTIMVVH